MSGGLDSQLAVRVLQRAGAEVEGVCFETPFFSAAAARKAAAVLGITLHTIDFTDDEITLIENPPHGFGGAMNPCIDCHAAMIRRAGEMMRERGFSFVATGEVLGQRPMSQNAQSLKTVEKTSGLAGRLLRPLSAKLLPPTEPEEQGLIDREALLDIRGRSRERQIALAKEFGIVNYPSPAGGCKLTEEGFGRKLRDLLEHEGLRDRRLVELLSCGRRFRLPGGTGVALGRDKDENARLAAEGAGRRTMLAPSNCPGPTALLTGPCGEEDLDLAARLVAAYSRHDRLPDDIEIALRRNGATDAQTLRIARPCPREPFAAFQIV